MSDKDFLVSMFTKLGEDNFKRLVTLTSEKCISELDLGSSENCKQGPVCDNTKCIDCLVDSLKKQNVKHNTFWSFLNNTRV